MNRAVFYHRREHLIKINTLSLCETLHNQSSLESGVSTPGIPSFLLKTHLHPTILCPFGGFTSFHV
ncbi:hypothetical protein SLEP1_g45182 [Rubroshorea leprosula]|uniref:Uncharacterized protein n=1 Tax=Rubroshorea leprosula TaxID=152421 RepID=A0AAV5LIK2_9ROSI|nr:hypothetical protein SLEP1_g45182 [Rubroshorea leprosula]